MADKDPRRRPVTSAADKGAGDRAVPSAQQQKLAAELRRTRLAAGRSTDDIAQEVGLPEPYLSSLETGQVIPSVGEVARWSDAVGASDRVRKQLRSLAIAVSEVIALPYWLQADVVALQQELGQLEASSMSQQTCLVGLVPGLLQTRKYTAMVMEFNALPAEDQEAAVNARLMRQAIIQDPERSFEFILTEAGLRWSRPGTSRAVLHDQILHIAQLSELPNISIGVVRSGAQTEVPFIQSYYIYEKASLGGSGEPVDLVVLETPPAAIVISDPMAVREYRRDLSWLREAAEFGADAILRIGRSRR
jgi:transcriptional regulator with XRE-family HTH domain